MTSPPAAEGAAAPVPMRRIALASCIGTTIEFYDFLIYGTAAALVFPVVFFPALGDAAGTVASLATFGVAFLARPIGAILFGHFGDRLGRKRTLIATLMLMGISTILIGLLPGAATLGIAAPVILVILRVLQGLAVGGEWAGATLLTAEYAPPKQRGRYAMFPQFGPSIAFALVSATFLLVNTTIGEESTGFVEYGWRIPFVASFILVAVGLYVRLRIEETPVFKAQQASNAAKQATGSSERSAAAPLLDVLKVQPREVLLGAGSMFMIFAFFYMGTTFLTDYGTKTLGLDRSIVLSAGIVAGLAMMATTAWGSIYSDRVGRRKATLIATGVAVPWALVLFPLLGIATPWAFIVGVVVTMAIFGFSYGPAGALLPELFSTRYRYTGAGMAYNLAGIVGGATAPLVAAQLSAAFGGFAIGVLLAGIALVSFISGLILAETKDREMTEPQEKRETGTAPTPT